MGSKIRKNRNWTPWDYSHRVMHLADFPSEEVKTSVAQKEKSKGICMEGYPEKNSFLTISPHSQLIQNHDAEVYAPQCLVFRILGRPLENANTTTVRF